MLLLVISLSRPTPARVARRAGLRYVSDTAAGIQRLRRGKTFRYISPRGRPLTDERTLRRIKSLAIPPAWTDVWICAHPAGHIQATGLDARGRKQYRYHAAWRTTRDRAKFQHLHAFARALPKIRRRVAADLRGAPTDRTTVLATLVRLLDTTLIRVGNEEYARANHSFGLSTLRHRHVAVRREAVRFHFRGKGGKAHDVELHDRRVAGVLRRLQDLPGQTLFQYLNAHGRRTNLGSADINAYLRDIAGTEITAKDFRTWAATLEAARLLSLAAARDQPRTKVLVTATIATVADRLRNTPAICRKCYIHPALITSYLAGTTLPFPTHPPRATQSALLRFLKNQSAPRP
ncbi:MAG: DNA topoisomerase IB [Verrucomicrobia bacterium]|nr:DNA topoisomerase IB [Verrucomicrobiota bacterium]